MSSFFPFLNSGFTIDNFSLCGNVPVENERLIRNVNTLRMSSAHVFSIFVLNSSKPTEFV